jgi:hypothetical protein
MPRNQEKHGKNTARESVDEHRILATRFSRNAAIFTTTVILATISTIFPQL